VEDKEKKEEKNKRKENVRFITSIQQLYNTLSHEDGSTYWDLFSCEGLLYSCYIGVVQESNPIKRKKSKRRRKIKK
jgi:hypothetical protein